MAEEKRLTISAGLQSTWDELTTNQRRVLLAAAFVVLVITLSGWLSSMAVTRELKKLEREAAHAAADKDAALKRASVIIGQIADAEAEKQKLEERRDEAIRRTDEAAGKSNAAAIEYDRAVRERRSDDIGAAGLCRELGELGYPCD